jgi:GNAT superfamily N-acetyltransferase
MIIRPATLSDASALFELARRFATSFAVEETAFNAALTGLLADSSTCLQVAEIDGAMVGYVLGFEHLTFFANGRVAWVEEIMVSETYRRHGVGKRLMESFSEWATARQCKLIALATRRADSFYWAIGYEESAIYFRKML